MLCAPGSRRNTIARRVVSPPRSIAQSNDQISRDAPPGILRSLSIATLSKRPSARMKPRSRSTNSPGSSFAMRRTHFLIREVSRKFRTSHTSDRLTRPSGALADLLRNSVAEQVEAENRKSDRESWRGREMRRNEQEGAAGVEHVAPTGSGRNRTEAKKRKRGFGADDSADSQRRLHRQRSDDAGQQMTHQQPRPAGAEGFGGQHVLALAQGQHFAAHDARVAGPSHGGQRDHEIDETGSENGGQRDRKQNARKGENNVHAAHHEVVDSTARQHRGRANQTADYERDRDDHRRNRK